MNELKVDIIKNVRFKKANYIFQAMSIHLKRKGLGRIEHTEAIEEDYLKLLYTSLVFNTNTPTGLLSKVWFDIMYFLCVQTWERKHEEHD